MTATQNINLAAFDIFMLLILFCAPASGFSCRIAADALPFGAGDIAQAAGYKASRIFGPQAARHFERSNRMPL